MKFMRKDRKGKEFYAQNYEKVLQLHKQGLSIDEIAKKLGLSYSAVYAWIKGRKPAPGNLVEFQSFLEKNGPSPVAHVIVSFPKHNEIFHVATSRGLPIRRYKLKTALGDYQTWYYIKGQEKQLEKRINTLLKKHREVQKRMIKAINRLIKRG